MEVFYIVLISFIALCNIFLAKMVGDSLYAILDIKKTQLMSYGKIDRLQEAIDNLDRKVENLSRELEQSSLSLQAPQSPMKPNNWVSMRAAFKGQTRVEIDE